MTKKSILRIPVMRAGVERRAGSFLMQALSVKTR